MAIALRSRSTFRTTATLAALIVVAALCGPVAAATAARWIVPSTAALPTGSVIVGSFPLADALVIESSVAPDSGVAYDTVLGLQSLPAFPDPETTLRVDSGVASTRAPAVWADGELGNGAVVALIDTGVAPVPALEDAVVGEIDFSGSGGGDGYGHGTFLASLIAGAGSTAPGVAPQAGILSLKVGDDDGTTTLGSVMSALHWLHSVGSRAGIRIGTLALSADPDSDAGILLDAASDAVADSGVLLITAAGNDGPGKLTSPATATKTFSVGSFNDNATADTSDDTPSAFSGTGDDRDGVAQPDASASGEYIVSSIGADSQIAAENPGAWVEEGLFRGSGTSMSTAITAGVAALASSVRPDLDAAALADALRAGNGVVDAEAAVTAALAAPQGDEAPRPKWLDDDKIPGAGHGRGKGRPDSVEPNGVRWTGVRWTGDHWGDENWEPGTWAGVRWTSTGWVGDNIDADWAGVRWTGVRWTGVRWTGVRWTGVRWTGVRWTGVRWTGVRWTMLAAPPA